MFYKPRYLESRQQISQLWEIDAEAYGPHCLTFEQFVGIFPLYPDQAQAFRDGKILERDLIPVSQKECEANQVADWYVSGIVIRPEYRNRGILRPLLRLALGAWGVTRFQEWPVKMISIDASGTGIGGRLLELCGFEKAASGSTLPDGCDMYERHLKSLSELPRF